MLQRLARAVPLVLALATLGCARTAGPGPALPDPAPLTARLTAQFARAADAWNRGDLDAFLADYAQDAQVAFIDGRRPQYGIAWIRDHYAPLFRPGAQRDSLRFAELRARPVAPGIAIVTARYLLERGGALRASGPFTLVMQETPAGWRILHDHSSADPR